MKRLRYIGRPATLREPYGTGKNKSAPTTLVAGGLTVAGRQTLVAGQPRYSPLSTKVSIRSQAASLTPNLEAVAARRSALIDKTLHGRITDAETVELAALERKMDDFLREDSEEAKRRRLELIESFENAGKSRDDTFTKILALLNRASK